MHTDRQKDMEEAWALLERLCGHPLSSKQAIFAIFAPGGPPRHPDPLQTAILGLVQNPSWQMAQDIVTRFHLCPLAPNSTC